MKMRLVEDLTRIWKHIFYMFEQLLGTVACKVGDVVTHLGDFIASFSLLTRKWSCDLHAIQPVCRPESRRHMSIMDVKPCTGASNCYHLAASLFYA